MRPLGGSAWAVCMLVCALPVLKAIQTLTKRQHTWGRSAPPCVSCSTTHTAPHAAHQVRDVPFPSILPRALLPSPPVASSAIDAQTPLLEPLASSLVFPAMSLARGPHRIAGVCASQVASHRCRAVFPPSTTACFPSLATSTVSFLPSLLSPPSASLPLSSGASGRRQPWRT